ncbi:hypothetical protein GGS23DRAFT_465225 [Durotheca rogersii]|uniref:uncharacterized protein n=1 Tax=Durotheca rogersii TaxID=419775 RepID=UPI00221FE87A|nr:uncharacterized protein GGS23DRAFT_465225 [Durotheca rogersii]KAI5864825.1 hypothetical protein GGS23DRAFT_465225 [Durotheca rogersii]
MPGIVEPEPAATGDTPPVELPVDDTPPRPYVVFTQNVDIDIDFREKRISGRSHILIVPTTDISEVFIDARQCEIDVKQITVSNCEVDASYRDPCECVHTPGHYEWSAPQWGIRKHRMGSLLHHRRKEVSALDHDLKCCTPLNGSIRVQLPSVDEVLRKNRDSQKSDQQDLLLHSDGTIGGYRISIPFKLKNSCDGLQFVGVDEVDTRYPHVYTRHSFEPGTASAIFPCIDDPGSRNSWRISITFPRTVSDAFYKPREAHQQAKGVGGLNGSRKRKHGEEEPRHRDVTLTEEDKLLEMTVVCSGYLTGEVVNKDDETKKTMTFEVDKNKAAKHIGFAVGPFEHIDLWSEFRSEEDDTKLGANAVKVHGYCLPGHAEEVRNTCAALVTAVDHLVLTFGRYPFESYKVCFVDDMIEETIPICAFSLCSTRLLYPQDIVDDEVDTTRTLVHALASQWFGVNIIPNTKADIWLVVGISWFMTDHFIKALCGNNEFRFRMKSMADRLVEVDIRRPSLQEIGEHLYLGNFEVDFMNLKAPLVLFILDRRLSKSSGTASISKIISRMVSKANTSGQASDEVLGSDAFRKACEKAGNTRLEHFWNQWVVMSGCPRFDVFQRFNKKRLCVEMTIRQTQDIAFIKARPIDKDNFWRDIVEESHAVYANEPQQSFTGPMTIRIHEADGTPYEHIVEIREDAAKSVKFEIPYNTKYKRLKRNRRQRERALASSNARGNEESQKDLYYLGDVMQHLDEIEEWDFRDWDEETEAKMDQESYEWIRMDADLEWLCDMQTNLPPYMYASQLQQDRDVVAQQDSMLFLHRSFSKTGPHPLVSTILTRTLLDPRYYYGIRIMAANELPRHAVNEHVNWIGLRHLLKTFQHFFCHPGTYTPLPNDFSDKRQYLVQCAIPEAVARIRGEDGKCPKEARRFILEQLQANDNTNNVYSDHLYICRLIRALAICQVPDEKKAGQPQMNMSMSFEDGEDEEMLDAVDLEPEQFRDSAVEEIERFRRMDQYSPSHQNCFTIAALDAFCHLMKAKVIPLNPIMFIQYLQDKTFDLVRIKACESLVELGLLRNTSFLRYFLALVSTDSSPYVRDRLFKALCRGLASIAIGEDEQPGKQAPAQPAEDGLIVEQDTAIIEAKQKAKARKEKLPAALEALKAETTDDEDLQAAVWNAIESPVLTVAERINFLELCSILFEEDQSLLIHIAYPTYWTVERGEKTRHRCLVTFKRHSRTKPRKSYPPTHPPPPKPEPKRTITLNLNRSMSFSAKATTPAAVQSPPPSSTSASAPKPSDTVLVPKSATNSTKQPPTPREKAKDKSKEKLKEKPKENPKENPKEKPKEKPKENSKEKQKEKPKDKPKEKSSTPMPKQPAVQGPKERTPLKQAKQAGGAAPPRGATPSISLEKPKTSESYRDNISALPPPRPTIEHAPPEPKAGPPKVNGNGNLAPAKPSKSLKRASTESDGPRPSKLVKLDTSRIPRKELELLGKSSKPTMPVKLKFNGWHKLRRRKDGHQAGSIRAAPKHRKPEDASGSNGSTARPPAPTISSSKKVPAQASSSTSASFPHKALPAAPGLSSAHPLPSQPSSQSLSQAQAQPGGGNGTGKPRKPLPDMRKPLPSAAPGGAALSKPPSASPPASKGPTKFKIKFNPPPS